MIAFKHFKRYEKSLSYLGARGSRGSTPAGSSAQGRERSRRPLVLVKLRLTPA